MERSSSGGPVLRDPVRLLDRPPHARSLYLARLGAGLTLRQVADRLSVTTAYLSKVETGYCSVSLAQLRRIYAAIGVEAPQELG